ncbi:hypothetical protein D9M70_595230 [compost metagenome]
MRCLNRAIMGVTSSGFSWFSRNQRLDRASRWVTDFIISAWVFQAALPSRASICSQWLSIAKISRATR